MLRRFVASVVVVGSLVVGDGAAVAESPPASRTWTIVLEGCQANPAVSSAASGRAVIVRQFFGAEELQYSVNFDGLTGPHVATHLHGPAERGQAGPVIATLNPGAPSQGFVPLTAELLIALEGGRLYLDVHSTGFPDGELRGQIDDRGSACAPPVDAAVDAPVDAPLSGPDGGLPPVVRDGGDGNGGSDGGCATGGSTGGLAAVGTALVGVVRRRRRR
jgi:uncharacterized protein (TIGR03382 family)